MREVLPLVPQDKAMLLRQMLVALAGPDALVSIEGYSLPEVFSHLAGVQQDETAVLKRNTLLPRLEFFILPLREESLPMIIEELTSTEALDDERGFIHIQIQKAGQLAFGAYDNIHPECTAAFPPVGRELLETLVSSGAITSYAVQLRDGA
jgi:hypothetical protein